MVVNLNVDLSGAIKCKLDVKLDGYVLQFCNEVGLQGVWTKRLQK
jgi:hypothetical protein